MSHRDYVHQTEPAGGPIDPCRIQPADPIDSPPLPSSLLHPVGEEATHVRSKAVPDAVEGGRGLGLHNHQSQCVHKNFATVQPAMTMCEKETSQKKFKPGRRSSARSRWPSSACWRPPSSSQTRRQTGSATWRGMKEEWEVAFSSFL